MIYMFHAECIELLDNMEISLLDIQDNGMNKENINSVFRAIHSIKGGASMFELKKLVEFTHTAENLLDEIRNNKIIISNEIITLFLHIKDHLNTLVDIIIQFEGKEEYSKDLEEQTLEYVKKLKEYLENRSNTVNQESIQEVVELDTSIEKEEDEHIEDIQTVEFKNRSNEKINATINTIKKHSATLKVDSSKIDSLINLVGEMVITTASILQHSTRINDKDLNESVHLLSRMLEDLREVSMKTRMVPVGDTFSRFKRVVRDLSLQLNKNIDLVIEGAETELDKTVIEKISDPLVHLIRNSIDHGVETIDERKAKGKKDIATIKLKAFHEANSIIIQVQDDGKGLDRERIVAKAIESGIISSDDSLKESEIYNLIMQPNFSTAQSISNISGRGVGMDVVKRNIEELRGTIDIASKKDLGMIVTIRLPLTLAIIDGFMIKIANDFYIIPLEMLLECIELTSAYKQEAYENNFINLRGHVLPLLDLREFFGYKIDSKHTNKENIVIVNFGSLRVGLIVDELLGEFQTVIKPIGKIFQNLKGIGGATILGDGTVSAILDIPVLLQYANKINFQRIKDVKSD